ncbi:hypothetical protein CASFOL_027394 [Castilleja foliolosa]|uniref:Reverse transcriptase domain-containing protein n=1 Tax=Castilleja foliolosa TaxID=1961234 RepID=A0ABD3CEP4_9LAMI
MHFIHKRRGPLGYMAIKIDLTIAFDRVEWRLLFVIMKQFGFCDSFINWISECLTTSSLSFILNGSPFGNFKPSRGIRQGDPLSPFLFVIYIELLSRLLAREESLNNFKGIKISRTAPSISHLLYADDLVIFCRATLEDALCINRILSSFSSWSSQLPNKEKSQIHFSSNTDFSIRNDIINLLGFKSCDHKSKHLGLYFCKPSSRKEAFKDTLDKVTSKLSNWKAKTLSQAGRSVMVKAVVHALPNYVMSTALLPINICNKLDAISRKFWWGSNSNGNSLMLKSWDVICSPKSIGGLGFRRHHDANLALMAKLAWALASNSSSPWISLIKAKYLRGKSFLNDNLIACNASWIWKDISSCRDLINNGSIYSISCNSDIAIWKDPWLPPCLSSDLTINCPNPLSLNLLRDCIDSDTCSWKMDIISVTFSKEVVEDIIKLHISPVNRPKTLLWSPSKSGKFSSRSVYLHSQVNRFSASIHSTVFPWKWLWNSHIHNRHKLLFWRIVNNILPCRDRLNSLFKISDTSCLLCKANVEDLNHIFLHCPFIRQVWRTSFWLFNVSIYSAINISQFISMILNPSCKIFGSNLRRLEFISFTAVLFENIWLLRNKINQGAPFFPVLIFVNNVARKAHDYWFSSVKKMQFKAVTNPRWKSPPTGYYKINSDASFANNIAFSGVVIRNWNGSIILAFSRKHNCHDSTTAECLAIMDACMIAQDLGIKSAQFESDCLNAITFINGSSENSYWPSQPVVDSIKRYWTGWPSWNFFFAPRGCNKAAHELAKWATLNLFEGILQLNEIPVNVFCDFGFPIVDSLCS